MPRRIGRLSLFPGHVQRQFRCHLVCWVFHGASQIDSAIVTDGGCLRLSRDSCNLLIVRQAPALRALATPCHPRYAGVAESRQGASLPRTPSHPHDGNRKGCTEGRSPTGGGSDDSSGLRPSNPQSLASLIFFRSTSLSTGDFTPCAPRFACWMVGVGELWAKRSLTRWPGLEPCPSLLDGAERSHMGTHKQPAVGLQVQGWASPPPPSCFRLGGPLARVLVLVA